MKYQLTRVVNHTQRRASILWLQTEPSSPNVMVMPFARRRVLCWQRANTIFAIMIIGE